MTPRTFQGNGVAGVYYCLYVNQVILRCIRTFCDHLNIFYIFDQTRIVLKSGLLRLFLPRSNCLHISGQSGGINWYFIRHARMNYPTVVYTSFADELPHRISLVNCMRLNAGSKIQSFDMGIKIKF